MMSPEETERYVRLGIEAEIKTFAGSLHQAIQDMERTLSEAGGQVYTMSRFKAPVESLRRSLDDFQAALAAREARFPVKERWEPEPIHVVKQIPEQVIKDARST